MSTIDQPSARRKRPYATRMSEPYARRVTTLVGAIEPAQHGFMFLVADSRPCIRHAQNCFSLAAQQLEPAKPASPPEGGACPHRGSAGTDRAPSCRGRRRAELRLDAPLGVVTSSAPTTETAACWIAVTANGRFAYAGNAGGSVTAYRVAPDGSLWVLTNNTDGRGSPRQGDDRIVRLTFP